jgi:very-short-patch-repair endonuclease
MLWLFRRHKLPSPEVNVKVGGMLVDFLLRAPRVVIETDGWRYHRGRASFEEDRARDARLRRLGFEVLRFSYRQVFDQPELVVDVIRRCIQERSALFSLYERESRRE